MTVATGRLKVHRDPPENRLPLPVVVHFGKRPHLDSRHLPFGQSAKVRAGLTRWIGLRLITDSAHLMDCFTENWSKSDSAGSDAVLYALAKPAGYYGVAPEFDGRRTWLRDRREMWQFGTEYYGTIKVSVRGLCSALARKDELFLHGCALQIGNQGLVLAGVSGAGKTTLTAALLALGGERVRVVNDDWGAVSGAERTAFYTSENRLHMKYRSTLILSPDLSPSPDRYLSENYEGDLSDPHARLLVPREDVFGKRGIVDRARIAAYVVVARTSDKSQSLRPFETADLNEVERGHYSHFYQRHERFLDGSLLLDTPNDLRCHRRKLQGLISAVPAWVLTNSGSPEVSADQIMRALEGAL